VTRPPTRLLVGLLCAALLVACTPGGEERGDGGGTATAVEHRAPLLEPAVVTTVEASRALGLKWNWAQLDAIAPHLQSLGGRSTFFQTEWCTIEPEPGERRWDRLDRIVADSRALGYELVLKIRVGSCWATGGAIAPVHGDEVRSTPSQMPLDPDAYQAFVRELVDRYGEEGIPAYAIENEPNALNFWQGTVEDYEALVALGAEAVRDARPGAVVLDAGVSSIGYGPAVADWLLETEGEAAALAFYDGVFARRRAHPGFAFASASSAGSLRTQLASDAGRRAIDYLEAGFRLAQQGVVDGFQLHYYEPHEHLPQVMAYLRAKLPAALPVWGLEVGVAWPGDGYDEDQHADEVVQLLATLLAEGVAPLMYLPVAWTPESREAEIWRGLVLPDGTPRPAADAYRRLVELIPLGEEEWTRVVGDGVAGVAYGSHATTVLLWAEEPRTLPVAPAGATAARVDGEAVTWGEEGLAVDAQPVVIDWPEAPREAIAALGLRGGYDDGS
jgi:hypothetical protein